MSGRLDLSGISRQEAFKHRMKHLSAIQMDNKDKRVCVIPKEGLAYSYTPKQALEALENHMSGKPNKIGALELKVGMVSLAYERRNSR